MTLIADGLMIAAALSAALYCHVLSLRLKRLRRLDGGVGAAISALSTQVEEMRAALAAARVASGEATKSLSEKTARAEMAAGRLELLLAALHDRDGTQPIDAARRREAAEATVSVRKASADRGVDADPPPSGEDRAADAGDPGASGEGGRLPSAYIASRSTFGDADGDASAPEVRFTRLPKPSDTGDERANGSTAAANERPAEPGPDQAVGSLDSETVSDGDHGEQAVDPKPNSSEAASDALQRRDVQALRTALEALAKEAGQ